MPTTYSNDIDLVRPTQYTVPPGKKAKQPAPEPWILPAFKPLQIDDFQLQGEPCLPRNVDNSDPLALFRLFFTNKIMDNIMEWINAYVE